MNRRHRLVKEHLADVRISWRKKNAPEGAFLRTPNTLKTPAGNTDWYKTWYEESCGALPACESLNL